MILIYLTYFTGYINDKPPTTTGKSSDVGTAPIAEPKGEKGDRGPIGARWDKGDTRPRGLTGEKSDRGGDRGEGDKWTYT